MKRHILYKHTGTYHHGGMIPHTQPFYMILEEYPAPDSIGGIGHRFVAGFEDEAMRDLMFLTMNLNNKCSHSLRKPRLRKAGKKDTEWKQGVRGPK